MKPFFLLGAALLLGHNSLAQFFTYHVSGDAKLKTRSTAQPLRPRDAVGPGQALVLKPGAQVVLIDQAGHNISYTKPGTIAYAALQQAFQEASTSTGRAYLAYVWKSLNYHAPPPAHQANAPLGGVARGDAPPLLAPADSAVLDQPVVAFQWQPAATNPASWFTLTDATGDPLLQLRTTAAGLELNTLLTRLKPNTVYYWKLSATPESAANAPRRAFVIADTEGDELFARELAELPATPAASTWQRRFRTVWYFERAARR